MIKKKVKTRAAVPSQSRLNKRAKPRPVGNRTMKMRLVSQVSANKNKIFKGQHSDPNSFYGRVDDELEALDTSLIMNTGRRTRGKKIDYTQFGADTPADEE
ncbi:hypothetical protein BCR42DRAFT_35936 [Absidia repens]|uniref:Histone chaperone domain-containing protein n=1 Tax=Absidia repens TaxID=90262 RepID=A0A1X2IGZ9_9FUNG|nr:hypothetical protein BCR42DRAFT_35936 [Absidia repens]